MMPFVVCWYTAYLQPKRGFYVLTQHDVMGKSACVGLHSAYAWRRLFRPVVCLFVRKTATNGCGGEAN